MKHRYLIGSGDTKKLKRNVPKNLQPLAGRTAWVESVRNLDAKALKQRAHLFAVRTDAEIERLKSQLTVPAGANPDVTPEMELSRDRAQQIAVSYFHDRLDTITASNALFSSHHSNEYSTLLVDAADDYSHALDEAAGETVHTDPKALKLLIACRTPPAQQSAQQRMPEGELSFEMGPYAISAYRKGCNVTIARIKSTVSLNNTYHQLLITSQNSTSAVFAINCLPVLAGGEAQCLVLSEDLTPPSAVADLGARLGKTIC